jgi:sulfane dehydrogenase subunit SoxC
MRMKDSILTSKDLQPAAGNGLFDRRAFFRGGAALAATMSSYSLSESAAAEKLVDAPWMISGPEARGEVPAYGSPSKMETETVGILRRRSSGVIGQRRTPHHLLKGTVTPSGVHFYVGHAGLPNIDPDQHRLLIHGLVERPLVFTLDSLERYPMETRMAFVECGGNSAPFFSPEPIQATVQELHGMSSCSEWTGVMLSTLLEETGIDPRAKWYIPEGSESIAHTRSVPLYKGLDDAMIALYQNGERIRPEQGYPMRMLLPGFEGNMNVKWLRRIELTEIPGMTTGEVRSYADLLPNNDVLLFNFINEVKSFITQPSPVHWSLNKAGFYEISGIAYSGNGRISKVMVTADGGQSWAEAELTGPVLPKAFTRFRVPWRWDGGPAVLQSRAWDEAGNVQPTRAEILAWRGQSPTVPHVWGFPSHHYNGPTSWGITPSGEVSNVYV